MAPVLVRRKPSTCSGPGGAGRRPWVVLGLSRVAGQSHVGSRVSVRGGEGRQGRGERVVLRRRTARLSPDSARPAPLSPRVVTQRVDSIEVGASGCSRVTGAGASTRGVKAASGGGRVALPTRGRIGEPLPDRKRSARQRKVMAAGRAGGGEVTSRAPCGVGWVGGSNERGNRGGAGAGPGVLDWASETLPSRR